MPKTIDVYREWLKIPDEDRPLSHYQLLRLKKFEDDSAKIREHYRKMNAHVRKYAAGEFAQQSQDLLNELARAMLCLTDTRRKGEYDASLGRKQAGSSKARTLEEILLAAKVVDQSAIEKARNFAKAVGVEVRDALVQQRLAKADDVLPAYAEAIGLPYLDLTDIPLDLKLISQMPPVVARQHSCIPVMIDRSELLMASPNPIDPNVEEELRLRFGTPAVRTVLVTPANIDAVIAKHVPRDGAGAPIPAAAVKPAADGAAATEAPPAKAKSKAREPLTPEEQTQRRNMALLGLGMTTIIVFNLLMHALGWGFMMSALVALPLAAAVAGVVWMVKSR